MSTSRAFNQARTESIFYRGRDDAECQTAEPDSMSKLSILFEESIMSIRDMVVGAEATARAQITQWFWTLHYNMWCWDEQANVLKMTEGRSRAALVDAELVQRECLAFAADLFFGDNDAAANSSGSAAAVAER